MGSPLSPAVNMSINFKILSDTTHLLIVNKPPNIPFHNNETSQGAVNLLRKQLGSSFPRLYPVHRLDSITSGALVFAKSPKAAREMIISLRDRKVAKYYVAISDRKPSKKQGSVTGDLAKGRRGSWMLLPQKTSTNPAITRFITTPIFNEQRPGLRAFLLKPETGRTHQLRVSMKAVGAPVLGDIRYANAGHAKEESRGYLHCAAMRMVVEGELVQVVCPPIEGEEFRSPGFTSIFKSWFPDGMEEEFGVWFPEHKQLRSSLFDGKKESALQSNSGPGWDIASW